MHPVVIEREADHNRVYSKNLLEVAHDRDRATLPDRERFLAPLGGERGAGFGEHWVVEGKLRCRGAGEALKLNPGIGRKTRAHERVEGSANFLRVLRTHQAKRSEERRVGKECRSRGRGY